MLKEERLKRLNTSLNLKENNGELIPDDFRKVVEKLFAVLTEIDFFDCACEYHNGCLEVTLSFGEHNRHIFITTTDDEMVCISYLGVQPTLGFWTTYYDNIIETIKDLLEKGKTMETRDGNYYKIVNGRCYLCLKK